MPNNRLAEGLKLTTGGKNDPLLPKLLTAINHATEIEISVSFIQPSGLALLFDAFLEALRSGATIKLLTSDYLSITHPAALKELLLLQERGALTRIYECEAGESFHMKSYIFVRTQAEKIIEGCAWVGSNNISKMALTTAHEWALRQDFNKDKTEDFEHIRQQFGEIFQHPKSMTLSAPWISNYWKRFQSSRTSLLIDLSEEFAPETTEQPTPNPIQSEALEALSNSRKQGFKRGLVVLATGMGKTWLSAFDVRQTKANKILFVAHREEILLQAEKTFIHLNADARTGLYNAQTKATKADYIFASIQTLGQQSHLKKFEVDHFDYIVIDEFHHASAQSYRDLLAYFKPTFLLGLTATPERSDQADILSLCDNNLVYEKNLVHGIDSEILVPFHYFGIYDKYVDYQEIPWRNGKFDPHAIDSAFATKKRAKHIFSNWQEKKQTRTLAFCVSTKHADYMSQYFLNQGVTAVAVHSQSPIRRNEALSSLHDGKIDVIFCVDIFNEGTDLPAIDTIMMLRPTESKILFLQQLGRGLRVSEETEKTHLTIIDFIGNHQSFLTKPAALLDQANSKQITEAVRQPPNLPKGCFVNYDPEVINLWEKLAKKYRATAKEDYQELKAMLGHRPTATEFFHNGYDLTKVRREHGSWHSLVAEQEDIPELSAIVEKFKYFLLYGIETTAMTKSFKAITLEALIELRGLEKPPRTQDLANKSWEIFKRNPDFMAREIKPSAKEWTGEDPKWHRYWLKMPIEKLTSPDKNGNQWFIIDNDQLVAKIDLEEKETSLLQSLVQELTELRLAEYIYRKRCSQPSSQPTDTPKVHPLDVPLETSVQGTKLSFFPDLKIACGSFKVGDHTSEETIIIPNGHGNLNRDKHFVAPASGNSMNGGKNAIEDGDLLLLEFITPQSAGSLRGQTVVIEREEFGMNEYLLRQINKREDGKYLLKAFNPEYSDMIADESMKTRAKLIRNLGKLI